MPLTDATSQAPPAPRHALLWASLVYAAFTLLLAYPLLGGAFLVSPISDQYIAGYPFREFAAEALRAGRGFPQWNPYQFGGMPYVAAMHGDIFYPTFLLRMILPTDVAMTLGFVVHTFLAGLFTCVFLRRVGLGFHASLVGGVAYMLSGQIASYAAPGHDGKLFVSALLPLFLWALHAGIRDGRRWAWGLVAIIVGLGVLSPHPQLLQYFLLMGGAYALFVAFGGGDAAGDGARPERALAIRRLGFALGAVVLGGLIGAIQFMPVFEYVDWSPRAGGAGWEHAISYSFPPEELINTYLPQFSGILEAYWGRNGIHFHSEYLGAVVLLLAGAAFGRAAGIRRAFLWFWVGTFVVTLLWALGGFTPFYSLVYAVVPGTKFFRAPSTIYYVVTFSVAVLAALGTHRALSGRVGIGYLGAWGAFGVVMLLMAVTGGLSNVARSFALPGREALVAANEGALAVGAVRSLVFLLVGIGLAWAVRAGRLRPALAGWLVAAAVGLDLWTVERRYWRFSPPASELYAADATIDYLRGLDQPARVLALQLGPTTSVRRDPYLHYTGTASGLMAHGVRTVLGYHGNELGRYQELLGYVYGPQELYAQLANPNVWRLLNVQYLLTDLPESPFEGAERVAGPARNAAGTMVYLYRMPTANPLAWVAPAMVEAPDESVLATVREPAFDVRSVALFAPEAGVESAELTRLPQPLELPVEVASYAPGEIALRLSAPAPAGAALVVSENYYPGWSATVDGQPAEVSRADYTLIGVPLPEGAREVTLSFDSAPYETGKGITLVAVLLSALLVGWGLWAERARRV